MSECDILLSTMARDKFAATWVSHSKINDFLTCPRAYYLKHVYRDPDTGSKIQLMSPSLALGSAVHEVIESLSKLPAENRFKVSLLEKFEDAWKRVSGKRGGFFDIDTEESYKEEGRTMLRRVMANPGPVARLAVKIKTDLPYYWLSEEDEIILCGKIDWLEYLPESDSVHILDFKTSKTEEDSSSLQLPIYYLLVQNTQHRTVSGASYWYLRFRDEPDVQELPDLEQAHETVLQAAKRMKTATKLGNLKCPHGDQGCRSCRLMEQIVLGEAELVGTTEYGQKIFVLPQKEDGDITHESVVL
jgi:CRISPR/Cas system-associated exonuclease Cas4 (RecB family)